MDLCRVGFGSCSEEDFVLESGEAAEFSCRVPHWLSAVGGPAEALVIFGPQGEKIHVR